MKPKQAAVKTIGNVTTGSLFAAIGGFCKAFQLCGARVLWANEKDRFATETFVANFPSVRHIHKPVEKLTVVGDKLEPVDILTAGFPCQPFSAAGEKKGFDDERGLVFLDIIRLLNEFGRKKPKILLLENVQYFRNHDGGRTFRRVQGEIQKAGYWFTDKNAMVLNTATHTDIPQNRDRLFMAAYSCDYFGYNSFRFPEPFTGKRRRVSEFLDLRKRPDDYFYFLPGSRYHPLFVKAMAKGKPDAVYQLRRNYVRENMSGECFTLMANMGDGGHNVPVIKDKWGIRKLTPRECARLQGYDDKFVLPSHLSRAQLGAVAVASAISGEKRGNGESEPQNLSWKNEDPFHKWEVHNHTPEERNPHGRQVYADRFLVGKGNRDRGWARRTA